jgi:2,3-bisphosphoglycerate-dependent phosphoglycerate mutase
MSKMIQKLTACLLILLLSTQVNAQTTKYIIIRHAEKDTTLADAKMMASDPPLNSIGETRALSLVDKFKAHKINQIYSTNYIRTKTTAAPIAKAENLNIAIYDPRKLDTFATQLMSSENNGKTFLIVGHSNSSPKLVNLLIKKDQFKDLDESIYDTYWIVTIKNGKTKVKMTKY